MLEDIGALKGMIEGKRRNTISRVDVLRTFSLG